MEGRGRTQLPAENDDHTPGEDPSMSSATTHTETKGKGKGKEKDQSLLDRLGASSKMMAGAAMSGNELPAASTAPAKTTVPNSFSHAKSAGLAGEMSSNRQSNKQSNVGVSFRDHKDNGSSTRAFDQFSGDIHPKIPAEEFHETLQANTQSSLNPMDGSAVVDLLSRPEADMEPWEESDDYGLTKETEAELREALFASGSQELPWDHLLNFTPEFVLNPTGASGDAAPYLGPLDEADVQAVWLRQWDEVLSSYTDEVWGFLAPLVNEAKRQVEDLSSQKAPGTVHDTSTGPLGRLRMLLAHVRDSSPLRLDKQEDSSERQQ